MILEIRNQNHELKKFCCVVFAGILRSYPDKIYVQQRYKRSGKAYIRERFIPKEEVSTWTVR
ncbi:hypothetical protein SAMN02745168_0622 [Papillibacter cinnamivorans DSM 12816]|uniref:Uncharacterized protein n=1 Tax=Papillibacter cinnamivorans DSM 12816 TaxID=1122930 RepID=A0A1W1YRC3_9FIRM|nr:hypothetical protein SAMN02745168_0622 [Papillibacter cinnamivorans DSM 12816]